MFIFRSKLGGFIVFFGVFAAGLTRAQAPEITSQEGAVTFKSGVNLVPVTVVVRDARGHAVGNLGIDDFELFDNGKPQMISKFTVERLSAEPETTVSQAAQPAAPSMSTSSGPVLAAARTEGIPDRFVAYFFDDVHMSVAGLVYTRDALRRRIDASPANDAERVAIYTSSGRTMQDFTADRDKLHAALAAIGTGSAAANQSMEKANCPPVTYYQGDLIVNKGDRGALYGAALEVQTNCLPGTPLEAAIGMARAAASQAVQIGDRDSERSLDTLRNLVSKLTAMPGRRSLVMISPGFLVVDDRNDEESGIIERAIHANVTIGALDARGLYTAGRPDASEHGNYITLHAHAESKKRADAAQSDVMANLTDGTGGVFYHDSNNYDEGIARTAATPEYLYVLGFSPLDLKLDGKFHTLKVTLKNVKGMDLQVREGYYAPKYATSPADHAKEQVEEAFFSRDEIRDLPAVLLTQYFKMDNGDATLTAVAKIDVKLLSFRKEDGRNLDNVTVVTGVFDGDGNYVTGIQKVVQMRLLDDTLQKRLSGGLAVKSSFTVHPGKYVVRMVAQDSEGQALAAQSSLVEIP